MGYIFNLRKKIGHEPIIMPSACVLVLNSKKQLLLQRRKDNGLWSYPGGFMELGESFEECACREVLEETGLKCLELELFQVASGQNMHYIYPNGDEVYIAEVVYLCRKYQGVLKVQEEEVIEQRFFDVGNLPDDIDPVNKVVIEQLRERVLNAK